jgi:hypothetical protein
MAEQCPLCERPRELSSEFCYLHNIALRNLESAYASWNKAYDGKLAKDEYFAKIATLPETGGSAREVVQHLRKKGALS